MEMVNGHTLLFRGSEAGRVLGHHSPFQGMLCLQQVLPLCTSFANSFTFTSFCLSLYASLICPEELSVPTLSTKRSSNLVHLQAEGKAL